MNAALLTNPATLRVDGKRLMDRLEAMARIGWNDGACCRLALTDEDRAGRDQLVAWMKAAGLAVSIDPVGNIFGLRAGTDPAAQPVMTGSHIDTVRTGGKYDGNLGVLGGLEVVQALDDAGIRTRRPLVVAAFSNEEGARFHPDILGSLVFAGGLTVQEAYDTVAIDGKRYGDELERIGYRGEAPVPAFRPSAYVELHIEQGPILDIEGITIGAVRDLQGISWQEVSIQGQSNHAGTTPMRLRRDAGYCAAAIGLELRAIAKETGYASLTEIRRQDEEWMRDAIRLVAEGKTRSVFTDANLGKTYGGRLTILETLGAAIQADEKTR